MKKHNFIPKKYTEEREKGKTKMYMALALLLFSFNLALLQYKKYAMGDLENYKVQTVFNSVPEPVLEMKKDKDKETFLLLYKEIIKSMNNKVSISKLMYENNKLSIELKGSTKKDCIDFLKVIESNNKFLIEKISPIEASGSTSFLRMELVSKT